MTEKKFTQEYIDNYFRMLEGNDDTEVIYDYFRREHRVQIRHCAPKLAPAAKKALNDAMESSSQLLALHEKFAPDFIERPENEKIPQLSEWIEAVNALTSASRDVDKLYHHIVLPEIEITYNNETERLRNVCDVQNYLFALFTPEYEAAQKNLDAGKERG